MTASKPLRILALVGSTLAIVVFAYATLSYGAPAWPREPYVEHFVRYAFLVAGLVAMSVAVRWPAPGGVMLVATGVLLGVATAGRYDGATPWLAAALFVLPGLLFLVPHLIASPRAMRLGLTASVSVLLVAGIVVGRAVHEYAFAPAHPQSDRVAVEPHLVEWAWSGAVTMTGATVNARLVEAGAQLRLVVSRGAMLDAPIHSQAVMAAADSGVASMRVEGLEPDTRYHYAIEVDGVVDENRRGSFRTFPPPGAAFSILVSSCARTGSNGAVFETMRREEAAAYIITGDFHYENIVRNEIDRFRSAYDNVLTAPAQAAFYATTPIAYVWDDHDYSGNNATAEAASREAARLAYRENVPHYALPAGDGDAAIYQAFTIGDVRFVMTDTRSERGVEAFPGGGRSMLGSEQRQWLLDELQAGSRDHALVVWVNPVPWIAPAESGRDDWGGFAEERRLIADFIAQHGIENLLMLSGDAHMLAIDDGTNSNYASVDWRGFPVLQAGALDRPGSVKGGPYSHGTFPGSGQYGKVSFEETARGMTVKLSGRNWEGEELVSYRFTVPAIAGVEESPP